MKSTDNVDERLRFRQITATITATITPSTFTSFKLLQFHTVALVVVDVVVIGTVVVAIADNFFIRVEYVVIYHPVNI